MMDETTPLQEVVDRYSSELSEITDVWESVSESGLVTGFYVPYAPADDGCIVALWDAWNRFVRDLLVTCARGTTRGIDGSLYQPAATRTLEQCLATLAANKRRAGQLIGGEPNWYRVNKIGDLAELLELENTNVIVAAIGSSNVFFGDFVIPNPLEEIRLCRNFTAHKATKTLQEVYDHVGSEFGDLRSHLSKKRYGSAVFYEWIEGCQSIATAAAK